MVFSPVTGVTGVTASLHEVACPDVDLLLTDSEPEPYVAPQRLFSTQPRLRIDIVILG